VAQLLIGIQEHYYHCHASDVPDDDGEEDKENDDGVLLMMKELIDLCTVMLIYIFQPD
jgi:hypothetical protein